MSAHYAFGLQEDDAIIERRLLTRTTTTRIAARSLCLGGDAGGETSRAAPVPLLPSHASPPPEPPPAKPGGCKGRRRRGSLSLHRSQWSWTGRQQDGAARRRQRGRTDDGNQIRYPHGRICCSGRQRPGSASRGVGGVEVAASAAGGRQGGLGGVELAAGQTTRRHDRGCGDKRRAWPDLAERLAAALAAVVHLRRRWMAMVAAAAGRRRLRQLLRWLAIAATAEAAVVAATAEAAATARWRRRLRQLQLWWRLHAVSTVDEGEEARRPRTTSRGHGRRLHLAGIAAFGGGWRSVTLSGGRSGASLLLHLCLGAVGKAVVDANLRKKESFNELQYEIQRQILQAQTDIEDLRSLIFIDEDRKLNTFESREHTAIIYSLRP
uniref:Uncharacterized protein n=1 Tax=Oryza meridionalis TaxID=40149 RepID=A0A0E0D6H9_9ORYZ